jgi:hypothetical protein
MNFLIDHNLGGHAEILLGNIASQGWLNLLPIRFVTFKQMNLSIDATPTCTGASGNNCSSGWKTDRGAMLSSPFWAIRSLNWRLAAIPISRQVPQLMLVLGSPCYRG